MLGVFLLIASVSATCETSCYVTCLSKSSLNTCSQACCKFDHIEFQDGKVFFLEGDQKLEIELEEVFFEIPVIPTSTYRKTENAVAAEPVLETVQKFPDTCEGRCGDYCKKSGPKCLEKCNKTNCVIKAPEAEGSYWVQGLVSVLGIIVLIGLFKPKTYSDGYTRLE